MQSAPEAINLVHFYAFYGGSIPGTVLRISHGELALWADPTHKEILAMHRVKNLAMMVSL